MYVLPLYNLPTPFFYTSIDRKHFRDVLKQQMADQDLSKSVAFKEKCQESKQSIAYDNDCRQKDMDAYVKKHVYLQNFRDGNKNVSRSLLTSVLYLVYSA